MHLRTAKRKDAVLRFKQAQQVAPSFALEGLVTCFATSTLYHTPWCDRSVRRAMARVGQAVRKCHALSQN